MMKIIRQTLAYLITSILLCATVTAQTARGEARRHLIVCVDGVGYSTIQRMRREGRFAYMREPARMIAPFPTVTNVAMTEIMRPAGATDSAGYEDSFYDAEANRTRGGILDRFNQARFVRGTFREFFDYHPSALKSGLGYIAPPLSTYAEALSDIIRLRQRYDSSPTPVFYGYTGATDSLAHTGGEWLTRRFLARLDNTIAGIIRESRGRTDVTIFSDHGNHFRNYRRANLGEQLRRAGFRLESRVRDDRSVVFPRFGLIACALLFTREANEERLAGAVAQARGVDFASYESNGIVHVITRDGRATIEKQGDAFRYRALEGDPLRLAHMVRSLTNVADAEGFIADEHWFRATLNNERPDAVRRIYEGTTGYHVRNRANVIVSFEDGYYAGSRTLDIFTFLQAAHGNARQEQTFGFLMTNTRDLPGHIRAEDVWQTIGSPQLNRSPQSNAAHR
jgi:hypothetical protein